MQLIEVKDKRSVKLFHKVPHLIYKGDENWACPLEVEVDNAFDKSKNSYLKDGDIIRWVLVKDDKPVGRIAAFYSEKKAHINDQPTGGCGFFECINDKECAFTLFDSAREWLKERGMEAMDGPVNPGENYVNWGLLVDGFMPQGYGMPYNPIYYKELFEAYGFKTYFEQYSYHLNYRKPFPERFWKIAGWIAKKPGYSFKHFKFEEQDKFVDDFVSIYDEAWRFHDHYEPLDRKEIMNFISSAKTILEEEFIWFAYHNDKPIALFVMVPDVNQILRKLNGKMNAVNILKFLYYKKTKTITRTRILIMGVVPQFQKSGVESAIFWHMDKLMHKWPEIGEIELSWAGDFNPKIISLYQSVGGEQMKTHLTLRYLFDRNKEFKRVPIISHDEK
ncbi:GNAT family N-acetyltransferase [Puteibacter caeruleilacunae]|nr:GNAT family N-acetyltransferase [Puteibacter caeruleilacunae]